MLSLVKSHHVVQILVLPDPRSNFEGLAGKTSAVILAMCLAPINSAHWGEDREVYAWCGLGVKVQANWLEIHAVHVLCCS